MNQKVEFFEKERGRKGFRKLKRNDRGTLIKQACEELEVDLLFYSSVDREIQIRERDVKWVQRRMADVGFNISAVQLWRYIKNMTTPDKHLLTALQNLLQFKWE